MADPKGGRPRVVVVGANRLAGLSSRLREILPPIGAWGVLGQQMMSLLAGPKGCFCVDRPHAGGGRGFRSGL